MAYRKLGVDNKHRRSMLATLTKQTIMNEQIQTTETRAKEVKRMADKMVTLGKKGDLHSRRQALSYIMDEAVVKKLFEETAPKYAERNGGYTRIIKTMPRRGDAAPMAIIELV